VRLEGERERCQFREGQVVVYRPSSRGPGQATMTDLAAMIPGERYRVSRVVGDSYVVVEGFEDSPTGGIYWTEFAEA